LLPLRDAVLHVVQNYHPELLETLLDGDHIFAVFNECKA